MSLKGDRIFASHGQWMKGQPEDGAAALLEYSVTKGAELSNPLDPNSAPTGKSVFVLDEFYESPAGIANHWQDAMANWSDLSALMAWAAEGSVVTLNSGEAVQALW